MWPSKADDKFNRQQHCIFNAFTSDKIRNIIFEATHLDVRIDKNKTKGSVISYVFFLTLQRNYQTNPIGKYIM